jgi:phage replication O-like protein O
MSASYVPHWQFPHYLNEHIPAMRHSVLLIVMAVCRQTLGWHKAEDTISYSQFAQLTGLCRQAISDAIQDAIRDGYITRRRSGSSYAYQLVIPDTARREKQPPATPPQSAVYDSDTQRKDVTRDIKESDIVDNSSMLDVINADIVATGAGAPLQNVAWLAEQAAGQGLRDGDLWELWRACRASRLRARVGYFVKALCGDGRAPQKPLEVVGRGMKRGTGQRRRGGPHSVFDEVRAACE